MLHYVLHAGSVPWQDQLLYAGLIIAVIAAVFFGLWWRKRASRPQQGDFAALVQQGNVAEALEAQAQSPLAMRPACPGRKPGKPWRTSRRAWSASSR